MFFLPRTDASRQPSWTTIPAHCTSHSITPSISNMHLYWVCDANGDADIMADNPVRITWFHYGSDVLWRYQPGLRSLAKLSDERRGFYIQKIQELAWFKCSKVYPILLAFPRLKAVDISYSEDAETQLAASILTPTFRSFTYNGKRFPKTSLSRKMTTKSYS